MSPRSPPLRSAPQPVTVDDDRITPPSAARIVSLGYPEAFNAARWGLEEAFNPSTGEPVAFPRGLDVAHRTTAQQAKLTPGERDAYLRAKRERITWCRAQWMRVPVWGGRAAPGGEYRYSARRCTAWQLASLGGGGDVR